MKKHSHQNFVEMVVFSYILFNILVSDDFGELIKSKYSKFLVKKLLIYGWVQWQKLRCLSANTSPSTSFAWTSQVYKIEKKIFKVIWSVFLFYRTKKQRDVIIKCFYGQVRKLIRHTVRNLNTGIQEMTSYKKSS